MKRAFAESKSDAVSKNGNNLCCINKPSSRSRMTPLRTVRIGCVPEHFSCPLYVAAERGHFAKYGFDVKVVNCPGGTGEMIRLLSKNDLDLAVALTEGLVAPLARGEGDTLKYRVVGTYVSTPLTWSVAVSPYRFERGDFNLPSVTSGPPMETPTIPKAEGPVPGPQTTDWSKAVPDRAGEPTLLDVLRGSTIGISRFGSGSHIIPFVIASQRGWLRSGEEGVAPFRFKELKNIDGLREGIRDGSTEAFLWERFTTKVSLPPRPYCGNKG
ncbi:hypothetical protein DFJ73DRAFT_826965 [Zopfochytrium polystomum]|nr:hypothetical protein DFJ73DRAFT_826965 [Zopfochytrium polystomum]